MFASMFALVFHDCVYFSFLSVDSVAVNMWARCPAGWDGFSGYCYKYERTGTPWADAEVINTSVSLSVCLFIRLLKLNKLSLPVLKSLRTGTCSLPAALLYLIS